MREQSDSTMFADMNMDMQGDEFVTNSDLREHMDIDAIAISPLSSEEYEDRRYDSFDKYSVINSDNDDEGTRCIYPLGRKPLVPISSNNEEKNEQFQNKLPSGNEENVYPDSSKNVSWISKTFCAIPSPSTVDTTDEYSKDEIVKNLSFDQHFCFVSDEGSIIVEDETDDSTKHRSFHEVDDFSYLLQAHENDFNSHTYADHNSPARMENQNQQLDETFDNLVQSNLICSTWRNWYEDGEKERRGPTTSSATEVQVPSHPYYNSSVHPSDKKRRMQYLSSNIEPFGMSALEVNHISSGSESPIALKKKTVSFSYTRSGKKSSLCQDSRDSIETKDCGWHNNIIACGDLSQTQEIEIVPSYDFDSKQDRLNHELCYDSDPGEMMSSPATSRRMRTRASNHQSNIGMVDANDGDLDDETSLEIISEHMTTKRLLVLHNDMMLNPTRSPVAVHAWIEHGSQLSAALVQPKLCWKEVNNKENQNKVGLQTSFTYHGVDLLDISKIIPMNEVLDRARYPFVKRRHSFLVESFGGYQQIVFEARNEFERDEIIEGLKLVVSRLGSKIMIGDSTVLREFFSPFGSVPGSIPAIIAGDFDNC